MSALAPTIEAFFTQRLTVQRDASPATIAAYRDALRLLLVFASERTGKTPARLDIADLDADGVALGPGAVLEAMIELAHAEGAYPCLGSFARFVSERGLVPEDALAAMLLEVPPKQTKLIPEPDLGTPLGFSKAGSPAVSRFPLRSANESVEMA